MSQSDATVRSVYWKDRVSMTSRDGLVEVSLPAPWLAGSIYCYHAGWIAPGAVCSFYFFLTGLRLAHGLQHYHLPVSHRVQDGIMGALSVVMMGSIHAIQATHLNHHRHCLDERDVEGRVARWPAWKALVLGPMVSMSVHRAALQMAPRRKRRWIIGEIVLMLAVIACLPWTPAGWVWHVLAMIAAESL